MYHQPPKWATPWPLNQQNICRSDFNIRAQVLENDTERQKQTDVVELNWINRISKEEMRKIKFTSSIKHTACMVLLHNAGGKR